MAEALLRNFDSALFDDTLFNDALFGDGRFRGFALGGLHDVFDNFGHFRLGHWATCLISNGIGCCAACG